MIGISRAFLMLLVMAALSSCHDTIHMHPFEEPVADEKAMLTLHIDKTAPQLGAIIDYTVSPAVIIYSDDLPERAVEHVRAADGQRGDRDLILQRAHSLAESFSQIAPYAPDGDSWDLYLKYEVYAGTAETVKQGLVEPVYSRSLKYRADAPAPELDTEVELPFGDLTVVAVAQYVPAGTQDDWFFRTTPLYNVVRDMDKCQGVCDNVYRDCFVVGQEYHIEPTGIDGNVQRLSATLTRPQGRYMVIADDYGTYLNIGNTAIADVSAHILYPSYINTAYSVLDHIPVASSYGFGYDFCPSLVYADGLPYVRLGDDWSFVNGNRSNFNVNVTVVNKINGETINDNPGILVPVFPGRVTFVVGHWLSEIKGGGGGVLIDPDFTDEIVIRF